MDSSITFEITSRDTFELDITLFCGDNVPFCFINFNDMENDTLDRNTCIYDRENLIFHINFIGDTLSQIDAILSFSKLWTADLGNVDNPTIEDVISMIKANYI